MPFFNTYAGETSVRASRENKHRRSGSSADKYCHRALCTDNVGLDATRHCVIVEACGCDAYVAFAPKSGRKLARKY